MVTIEPGNLLIGAQQVAVVLLPAHIALDWVGESDTAKNVITLREGQAPTAAASTLLHEVIHFWLSGVYSAAAEREEELVVNLIERGLISFMRDNPGCVRRVLDILEEDKSCQKQ